jgi:hypothetical protein
MLPAELLGLDSEVVRSHAEAYEGLAFAIVEEQNSLPSLSINYLGIAASYWSAVDITRGRKCFQWAYEKAHGFSKTLEGFNDLNIQRRTMWALRAASMATCSRIQPPVDVIRTLADGGSYLTPNTLMAALVAGGPVLFTESREQVVAPLKHLLKIARSFQTHPVGKLRVPLSLFVELIDYAMQDESAVGTLSRREHSTSRRFREWTVRFGERLSERVTLAQSNHYHWQRLHSSLLPLEPDAVCALIVWAKIKRHLLPESSQNLSFISELPRPMKAYIEAVSDVWNEEPPHQYEGSA